MKKPLLLPVAGLLWLAGQAAPSHPPQATIVDVSMIWGRAPHNAFTALVKFRDRWYCAFREGQTAVSPDGRLRLLTSADATRWLPVAELAAPETDLRYPKFSATPDGRLLLTAATRHGETRTGTQTLGWLTPDARRWEDALPLGGPGYWIGPVRWQRKQGFGIALPPDNKGPVRIYSTANGRTFVLHAQDLGAGGGAEGVSLLFLPGGDALCLLGSDGSAPNARLGRSRPPYRSWQWTDLKMALTAPEMALLPDGRIVVAARVVDESVRTSLLWLDPEAGSIEEFLTLPSGGDSGWPGIVYDGGLLRVSYYSSHEGRAMIYMAAVKLAPPQTRRPVTTPLGY